VSFEWTDAAGPWEIQATPRDSASGRADRARLPALNGRPIHLIPAHKGVILCEAIEIRRVGHKLDMGYLVASNPMVTRPGAGASAHAWEVPTWHR